MFSLDEPTERLEIREFDAQLRRAHFSLLNAQQSTRKLRLNFSIQELVRRGHRDALRTMIAAAHSLHDYYSLLGRQISGGREEYSEAHAEWNPPVISECVACLSAYLLAQRDNFFPVSMPLSVHDQAQLQAHFSPTLLRRVRFVELHGNRLPPPAFYAEARLRGLENLPEITHMVSLTFVDVVVFNDRITERGLFHALVHAAQFRMLGLERYSDLFVRSFLRTRRHVTVPLESHAFALEARFLQTPPREFSAEREVQLWVEQGRYEAH